MQNDIASVVGNALNSEKQTKQMVNVIKSQADEIQKRGLKIVDLEDKNEILQKNISLLVSSNKNLEHMLETLKVERQKLLEEIEDLKNSSDVKVKKTKTKTSAEKVQQ
jgi:adenylosuccinate synthase